MSESAKPTKNRYFATEHREKVRPAKRAEKLAWAMCDAKRCDVARRTNEYVTYTHQEPVLRDRAKGERKRYSIEICSGV